MDKSLHDYIAFKIDEKGDVEDIEHGQVMATDIAEAREHVWQILGSKDIEYGSCEVKVRPFGGQQQTTQ